MKMWWQTLNAREQTLVWVGSFAILVTMLFLTVLEPIAQHRGRLEAEIRGGRVMLGKLRLLAEEATRLRGHAATTTKLGASQSLLALINDSAKAGGLAEKIARVVPKGENEASITLDGISFDLLIGWMIQLQERFGVTTSHLVIDRSPGIGQVNASLTFTTGV